MFIIWDFKEFQISYFKGRCLKFEILWNLKFFKGTLCETLVLQSVFLLKVTPSVFGTPNSFFIQLSFYICPDFGFRP